MNKKLLEQILTDDIYEIKKLMFTKNVYAACRYLWGPEGVGKSTLIKSWMAEISRKAQEEEHVYYFYLDFKEIESTNRQGYWEIWKRLLNDIEKKIPKSEYGYYAEPVSRAYQVMEYSAEEITARYAEEARYRMDNLFDYFNELGIHIVVVMDNFEEVTRIFPEDTDDGLLFQRLFELSPKGSLKDKKLSILLISDRCIEETVHHMDDGSTFDSAYKSVYLGALEKQGTEEYYALVSEVIGEVNDNIKARIEYYCGSHIKMLMMMYELLSEYGQDANYDIDKVYEQHGAVLKEYYEHLYRKLEEMDLVDFWSDIMSLEDSQEKEWSCETLYECGFLFREYYSRKYSPLSPCLGEYIDERVG